MQKGSCSAKDAKGFLLSKGCKRAPAKQRTQKGSCLAKDAKGLLLSKMQKGSCLAKDANGLLLSKGCKRVSAQQRYQNRVSKGNIKNFSAQQRLQKGYLFGKVEKRKFLEFSYSAKVANTICAMQGSQRESLKCSFSAKVAKGNLLNSTAKANFSSCLARQR